MKKIYLSFVLTAFNLVVFGQTSDPGVTSTGNAGGSNHAFRGTYSNGTFSNWMNSGYSATAYNLIGSSDPHAGFGVVSGNNIVSPVVWMYANSRNAFSVRTMNYQGDMTSGSDLFTVRANGSVGIGKTDPGTYRFLVKQASSSPGYGLRVLNANEDKSAQLWVGTGGAVLDAEGTTNLHLRTGGADRIFIKNDGKVGIGLNSPSAKLHVNGGIKLGDANPYNPDPEFYANESYLSFRHSGVSEDFVGYKNHTFYFKDSPGGGDTREPNVVIGGKVSIGTTNISEMLTVAGNINSREVKVSVDAGADFVFKDGYEPPSIEEVEAFVNQNKHLPEIPSEDEMLVNGLMVGEMNIRLLQKIEELTLYVIEINKQMKSQYDRIEQLTEENEKIKNELSVLKADRD